MLWVQVMHRLSLILLLAAAAACRQEQTEPPAAINTAEAPSRPIVPKPRPPVDRPSLLAAVAEAASASAAGAPVPESIRALDGRQFEFRIRFGCRGPATDLRNRWLGWSFDAEKKRIRVRATPTISRNDPLVAQFSNEEIEAVEGFWIPRPWLLQPVCPVAAGVQPAADGRQPGSTPGAEREAERDSGADQEGDSPEEPVPVSARIGIAQFFTTDDPRTGRRDMRPYEASHTLAEGKAISSQGYDLVLAGRLRAFPGRGVIQCSARSPDSPPECIVSAEFLRVWIEQPGTGDVIAEWGGG